MDKVISNLENNLVVMLIPYFGKLPNYFRLWKMSAEKNPHITFCILTDQKIEGLEKQNNIKIYNISFKELKEKIQKKIDIKIILNNPYKLCDYKPAYGYVMQEEISQYKYWGFCDIDLIFGDLNSFLPDSLIEQYDKLFFEGHFCIMKNCKKMNELFLKKYKNVLDYKHAFSTRYSCHFDENGTIAYAPEEDLSIKYYNAWNFWDVPSGSYKMLYNNQECYAIWNKGKLYVTDLGDKQRKEIMYIHLQKRAMYNTNVKTDTFSVYRDEFFDSADLKTIKKSQSKIKQKRFEKRWKKMYLHIRVNNILQGALKMRIYGKLFRWKTR